MQFTFPPLQGKSLIWAVLMKIENVENIPHAMSHGQSLMNFYWSLSISRTSNGSRSQPPIYRQCARPAPDKDLQPTRQIVDDHSATTPSSFNLNSIRETSALRCTISRWVTSISFGRFLKDCFDHYHII